MLKANEHCCEEASPLSYGTYVPCNEPAAYVVQHVGRSEGPYRMCESCANHNVRNRGGRIVKRYDREDVRNS